MNGKLSSLSERDVGWEAPGFRGDRLGRAVEFLRVPFQAHQKESFGEVNVFSLLVTLILC